MIYPYKCNSCGFTGDVIKSISDIDNEEKCKECGTIMTRYIAGGSLFMNTSVEEAEYNPGLGCWVKNKKHRAEIAKRKGLEEVGNEDINKHMDKMDRDREERLAKKYDDIHEWWAKEKRMEI